MITVKQVNDSVINTFNLVIKSFESGERDKEMQPVADAMNEEGYDKFPQISALGWSMSWSNIDGEKAQIIFGKD